MLCLQHATRFGPFVFDAVATLLGPSERASQWSTIVVLGAQTEHEPLHLMKVVDPVAETFILKTNRIVW